MVKKLVSSVLAAVAALALVPAVQSHASSDVPINEQTFPDPIFRDYVSSNFDKDWNGKLSVSEASAVQFIGVSHTNIMSAKGIEYFTKLKRLYCGYSPLTSLDISNNTDLEELYCENSQLTSLDVSNNKALTSLWCTNNQLTSLDVSNNTALEKLFCNANQLTSLDVSNNTALEKLFCNDNQLTSLDVSDATALEDLSCSGNQLTSLDVSDNISLEDLSCSGNQLTSLDVSDNISLRSLWCTDNLLTSLDVSNNTSLEELSCHDNQLTSLDVSNNTALKKLWCYVNKLTSLDVSDDTSLTDLRCYDNKLTSLDVSNNTALEYLWCSINNLTSLDVSKNTSLENLWCDANKLTVNAGNPSITIKDTNFDISRVVSSSNLTWNGTTLTLTGDEGSYTYDAGNSKTMTVTVTKSKTLQYDDVPVLEGNWKYESVKFVTDKGLMGAISGTNSFYPDDSLTRAMFATILYRAAGSPEVTYSSKFSDVSANKWYSLPIMWANASGIVNGYSDGSFGINDPVTRDQIAKMLYAYASSSGYDVSLVGDLSRFADASTLSSWAITPMKWAVGSGIISGRTADGMAKIDPKGNATRAECAKMLKVFMETYVK